MKINFLCNAQFLQLKRITLLIIVTVSLVTGCSKVDQLIEALHPNKPGSTAVDIAVIADSLVSPLGVVAVPEDKKGSGGKSPKAGGDKRLFVIDQIGKIWIIDADGKKMPEPFLDISSKMVGLNAGYDERGLLGFALHPEFSRNGRFFVYYTAPPRPGGPQQGATWNNLSRISEFHVSGSNSNAADMNSEKPLLEINDPQSNHNGGTIAFGPDNYLYIAIGDGGAANDVAAGHVEDWYPVNQGGNGQDLEANLFGDILRIDVDRGNPYGIPGDNPFVGRAGRDEIYAYGFRNPYRFSFDMGGTHRLFAGDAGQVLYEEVSVVEKGKNYGWNVKEGTHCFNAANNDTSLPSCPSVDPLGNMLIDPVIEVTHFRNPNGQGRATTVIGGNVYRGKALPQYSGKYIFGTFSQGPTTPNGELFATTSEGPGLWSYQEIPLRSSPNDIGYFLKGFGQDNQGEIYLTVSRVAGPSGMSGRILKLVPAR